LRRRSSCAVITVIALLVLVGGVFGVTNILRNVSVIHFGVQQPTLSAQQSPTPGPTLGSNSESQIAQVVFQAINKDRVAAGLPALQWNDALVGGAHKHNLRMAAANQLAHQLPGEPDLGARITQDGLQWVFAAENIGETSDQSVNGTLSLHKAMMAERPPDDGHRQNILTRDGTTIGIDVLIDGNTHMLWLTEDFAKV